jgi:hypothetical protein
LEETGAVHEKNTTMNFFEAVRKNTAEITGIVLAIYEEQNEDAKKIHDEMLSVNENRSILL